MFFTKNHEKGDLVGIVANFLNLTKLLNLIFEI